jgi:glycosyltransferase involved in cell wall biosynthesis
LHIVIDVRHWRDFGIGTYIRNLVRALARVDQHYNQYTLIGRSSDLAELREFGSRVGVAAYDRADDTALHNVSFPHFLRKFPADLYHIPLNSVAYLMPRPYVLTIHDMSTLLYPSRGEVRSRFHEERYRRGAARAARIITVSHATRRDLQAVLHIPPQRIRTIYSAPDPAFTGPSGARDRDAETLERYSIQHPFILYAGTIRPQKNIPRLVEAFAVLRGELENHPQYSGLRLVIIGDDLAKNPSVRRAVIATRMEPFVRFLGFVSTETLKVFYRAAELFVFPSLYEGFGLAPLEAMACGTPVVASSLPALVEAVGDAAELVNPEHVFDISRGIRDLLLDRERRSDLRSAGRLQAQKFQWDDTARAVLDVYREINR